MKTGGLSDLKTLKNREGAYTLLDFDATLQSRATQYGAFNGTTFIAIGAI
jgi:hypothetical protein